MCEWIEKNRRDAGFGVTCTCDDDEKWNCQFADAPGSEDAMPCICPCHMKEQVL